MSDNQDNPEARIAALEGQVKSLERQLAAHKGQVTKARKVAAQALAGDVSTKPRKFAAIDTPLSGYEIAELAADADDIEIAFFDEKRVEVAGLAPFKLSDASALELRGGRLHLAVPSMLVHGPRPGDPALYLAGYALLLDGELVAVSVRPDELAIGAGTQYELKGDVVFG